MSYYVDRFELKDHKIVCYSKSGNTYSLFFRNENFVCTCKGFCVRGSCRHVDEATENGLRFRLATTPVNDKVQDNYCRHCGKKFETEDNYCGGCGKKRA
jgi:hypothetical protein